MGDLNQLSLRCQNIYLSRVDAAAIHSAQAEFRPEMERLDGILKDLERNARIDQRGKEHISADSGEAIEIRNLHFADSLIFIPLIAISDSGRSAFIEPER